MPFLSEIRKWEPGPDLDAVLNTRYPLSSLTSEQVPSGDVVLGFLWRALSGDEYDSWSKLLLNVKCVKGDRTESHQIYVEFSQNPDSRYSADDPVEVVVNQNPHDDAPETDEEYERRVDESNEKVSLVLWQSLLIGSLGLWEATDKEIARWGELRL